MINSYDNCQFGLDVMGLAQGPDLVGLALFNKFGQFQAIVVSSS